MKKRDFVRLSVAGAMALLAVSCAASRNRTHSAAEQTVASQKVENLRTEEKNGRTTFGSLVREETVSMFEAVPAQAVAVEVPLAALDSLPEEARFGARNGRTEVIAIRRGDKLMVEARSDSLARAAVRTTRCEVLQHGDSVFSKVAETRIADSLCRESFTEETSARNRPAGLWWLAAGFVLCAVLFIRRRR